jgi:hypothetical protein
MVVKIVFIFRNKTKMFSNLYLDNNLNIFYIIIGSGIIIKCSLYYLFLKNSNAIPSQNVEAFTHEEIEAIINENGTTVMNTDNIDDITITDSDFETDITSDFIHSVESDSSYGIESVLDDPNLFFMPFVDFDVCPIEELKFFEFNSLYAREIIEHSISDEEIREFIS